MYHKELEFVSVSSITVVQLNVTILKQLDLDSLNAMHVPHSLTAAAGNCLKKQPKR